MYAVEYYCSSCDDKGYKDPTDHDLELYESAGKELEEEWDELPIPEQDRYQGSSDRAWNHGYHKYHEMFNDRQLLLLGRLLNEIDDIEDQNVKEFLLTTFSAMLESNNMFCMYNRVANKLEPIYNYNTIIARHTLLKVIYGAVSTVVARSRGCSIRRRPRRNGVRARSRNTSTRTGTLRISRCRLR